MDKWLKHPASASPSGKRKLEKKYKEKKDYYVLYRKNTIRMSTSIKLTVIYEIQFKIHPD